VEISAFKSLVMEMSLIRDCIMRVIYMLPLRDDVKQKLLGMISGNVEFVVPKYFWIGIRKMSKIIIDDKIFLLQL